MDNIRCFIGSIGLTVSEAMQAIDQNTCGILFLVDDNERLYGCITDGDIRRFLLSGGKMSSSVVDAANIHPRIAKTVEEARTLYHKKTI